MPSIIAKVSIFCVHLCAAQMPEARGDTASFGQLIPDASPRPESVVPGRGGYFVSHMPTPSPPAPAPVPGSVAKYNMDGTRDENFASITMSARNAGLAISSDDASLYVTSGGSVIEYALTDSGASESRTFDLSAHTTSTNGLCLSHDGALLYVTEPGMALNPMAGGVMNTPDVNSALLVITLETGAVEALFTNSADDSPNGCFVSPDDPNLVYTINFEHGVRAWNKNSGSQAVTWGSDLQSIQQTQGDVRCGDGIVHYDGMWYVSLWKVQMGAPAGAIYSCSSSGTTCTVFVADLPGADLQLDLRDANRPILIAPSLPANRVMGIELPLSGDAPAPATAPAPAPAPAPSEASSPAPTAAAASGVSRESCPACVMALLPLFVVTQ